ncbi:MAG TPA: hypothetical protein VN956_19945, partial [Pyrinomonadaceae bacterium]|nr:hypothetical protein [Pyrinomonadaceae bacterium]
MMARNLLPCSILVKGFSAKGFSANRVFQQTGFQQIPWLNPFVRVLRVFGALARLSLLLLRQYCW